MKKYFISSVFLAAICVTIVVSFRAAPPSSSTTPMAESPEGPKLNGNPPRVGDIISWKSSDRSRQRVQTTWSKPDPQQTLFKGPSSEAQLDAAHELAAQGTEQAAETLADFIAKASESPDAIQQQLAHDVALVLRQMTTDTALPMMLKLAYHRSELVAEAAVDAAVARDEIPVELQQGTIEPTLQVELDTAAQALLDDLIWGRPVPTPATSESSTSQ